MIFEATVKQQDNKLQLFVDASYYDFQSAIDVSLNDKVMAIKTLTGKYKIIEKITNHLIDDYSLKLQLDMPLYMPLTGVINSLFGPRRNPSGLNEEFHNGIDISGEVGDPIWALHTGTVTHAQLAKDDPTERYGSYVVIQHDNKFETIYAHLDEINVSIGDVVIEKTTIGTVGNTGKSSGPHLHIGMEYNGKELNPRVFLGKQLIMLGRKIHQGEPNGH